MQLRNAIEELQSHFDGRHVYTFNELDLPKEVLEGYLLAKSEKMPLPSFVTENIRFLNKFAMLMMQYPNHQKQSLLLREISASSVI